MGPSAPIPMPLIALRLDLLIPDLSWPHDDVTAVLHGVSASTLERWLSLGTHSTSPASSAEQWLWARFVAPAVGPENHPTGATSAELPIAPVTLAGDGGHPGQRWWMRADPVHLVVGRTGLRLAPVGMLDLTSDEATALAEAVHQHFPNPRFRLCTPSPGRWYLGSDAPFNLDTTPPSVAVGDDISRHLPRGPGRMDWLGFINEVQMLWFEHPVNLARERRGAPVASSLWFHGPGRLPERGSPRYSATAGGDGLLAGLSALARRPWQALDGGSAAWLSQAGPGHWLLQLDDLVAGTQAGDASGWRDALARLDREWLQPLDTALRAGRISEITLVCPSARRLRSTRITASDRFRFWRSVRPLVAHA